jgi:hypothetical protein
MESALVAHMAGSSGRYSNTLEFSFSVRGGAESAYRFSYAFPAFGGALPEEEIGSFRRLVAPFGKADLAAADRILSLAARPVVEQVLFGVEAACGERRLKIYLQFARGFALRKQALLARALPPAVVIRHAESAGGLHLLGVDIKGARVAGYKLYFLRNGVSAARLACAFPSAGFLRHLASRQDIAFLDDVVLISRFGADGSRAGPLVGEVDLGLAANRLSWERLAEYFSRTMAGLRFEAFRRRALTRRRWAATRVSIPASAADRLTVYYVLLDPPRPDRSRQKP